MSHIVVVGSLNMDLVVKAPRIPRPGETVLGSDFRTFPGGKGANQAVAAARLGARVTMIGCVGADAYGDALIANLKSENVDTSHIVIDQKVPTGVAMITVSAEGQNSITVASGANYELIPSHIVAAWTKLDSVDLLVMPLETPAAPILTAAQLAKESGATVVLNPAPARELDAQLLKLVDVLVPNEHEAAQLANMAIDSRNAAQRVADRLIQSGVGNIVITLGDKGALAVSGSGQGEDLPPYQVDVVDTTAAGDAFVAALAVGIGDGKSIPDAARFANAAGALAATKPGAQPSLPFRDEVERLIESQHGR